MLEIKIKDVVHQFPMREVGHNRYYLGTFESYQTLRNCLNSFLAYNNKRLESTYQHELGSKKITKTLSAGF